MTPDEIARKNVFVFSHPDDPVANTQLGMFARKPKNWTKTWRPVVTGWQSVSDLIRSTAYKVEPGDLASKGPHDYREAHAELIRAAALHDKGISDAALIEARTGALADEAAYPVAGV
jgi:hypothetical protein